METALVLLVAVVAGRLVQMYLTYQQSMAFNRRVATMRDAGTITVGVAGKRYRGGRAFVALAVDERGVVRDALTLSGWTTFSRGRPLPDLVGARVKHLRGDRHFPGVSNQQRAAAREAVTLLRQEGGRPTPAAV